MAMHREVLLLVLAVAVCEVVVSVGADDSSSMVETICNQTRYKDICVKSLGSAVGNSSDPKEIVRMSFKVAKDQISKALEESKTIQAAKKQPKTAAALETCRQVCQV